MKDKLGVIASIGIALVVVLTLGLYLIGNISTSNLLLTAIVLILVALTSIILWDRWKNIKEGYPAKDERLEKINYKAGFYGFIAAIWSAVGSNMIPLILWDYEIPARYVVAVVVLVSGFVFVISWLYLSKKGTVE